MELLSPCTGVCTLDVTGLVCVGCRRTIREITHWTEMDNDEKRKVLDRLAALAPRPAAA